MNISAALVKTIERIRKVNKHKDIKLSQSHEIH